MDSHDKSGIQVNIVVNLTRHSIECPDILVIIWEQFLDSTIGLASYMMVHNCFRKRRGHSRRGRCKRAYRRVCRTACRRGRCSRRSAVGDGCSGSGGGRGCRRQCGVSARRTNWIVHADEICLRDEATLKDSSYRVTVVVGYLPGSG